MQAQYPFINLNVVEKIIGNRYFAAAMILVLSSLFSIFPPVTNSIASALTDQQIAVVNEYANPLGETCKIFAGSSDESLCAHNAGISMIGSTMDVNNPITEPKALAACKNATGSMKEACNTGANFYDQNRDAYNRAAAAVGFTSSSTNTNAPSTNNTKASTTVNKSVTKAPQNTKTKYKAAVLDACSRYQNDIDKQSACITGGMGIDGLQYYPSIKDTCEFTPGFKAEGIVDACIAGVEAGKTAFNSIYSANGGINGAYEQAIHNSCNQFKGNDAQWLWCIYGGMGQDGKEGFPAGPTNCLAKPELANQDDNQNACLEGVASGNSILLNYAETGTILNADGSKITNISTGGTSGGGSGGGSGSQPGADGSTPGSQPGGGDGNNTDGSSQDGSQSDGNAPGSNTGNDSQNEKPSDPRAAAAHRENLGADKNGPGTVTLEKIAGPTAGLPFASKATASYVDGGGGTQTVDFFHPDDKKRPVIIFVPGGGWRADGGTFQRDFQERAGKKGFASIRANYRKMPNGIYGTFNDIQNLLTSVKENADTYNIDPSRIVMWGDSAGGSLTVRTAATGTSGLNSAVGWSAPTNALRDMFTVSVDSFLIGIDHSTCFNTEWTQGFEKLNDIWRGYEFLRHDPLRVLTMSEDEQRVVMNKLLDSAPILETSISQMGSMMEGWEIDFDRAEQLVISTTDALKQMNTAVRELDPSVPISRKPDLMANSSLGSAANAIHTLLPRLAKDANMSEEIQQQVRILTTLDRALQNGFNTPESLAGAIRTIAQDKEIQQVLGLDGSREIKTQDAVDLARKIINKTATQDEIIDGATPLVKAILLNSVDTLSNLTQVRDENGQTRIINSIHRTTQKTGEGKPKAGKKYSKTDAKNLATTALTDQEIAQLAEAQGFTMDIARILTDDKDQLARLGNLTKTFESSSNVIARNVSLLADDFYGTSNKQILPIRKIAECIDNVIAASPSLFASPHTPPMLLANAEHERVTPAADAYEMVSKLRSYGTRAEALILPGDLHMGFDERAVEPSFKFIREETKPEPLKQPEPPKATVTPGPRWSGAAASGSGRSGFANGGYRGSSGYAPSYNNQNTGLVLPLRLERNFAPINSKPESIPSLLPPKKKTPAGCGGVGAWCGR